MGTAQQVPKHSGIAIVCSGPSSRGFNHFRWMYDKVVVVNNARKVVEPYDYHAYMDTQQIHAVRSPLAKSLTQLNVYPKLNLRILNKRKELVSCSWGDTSWDTYMPITEYCPFTMVNTIATVRDIFKPKAIHLYGVDFDNGPDVSGNFHNHVPTRWLRELKWLERVYKDDIHFISCRIPTPCLVYLKCPNETTLERATLSLGCSLDLINTTQ